MNDRSHVHPHPVGDVSEPAPSRRRSRHTAGTPLHEQLLAAADTLLAERPVATLTTREVARRAGLSDGVLYNYFSDKQELVVAALTRRFERLVAAFLHDLPAPGSATVEADLLAYGRAALQLNLEGMPLIASLMGDRPMLAQFMEAIHRVPHGWPRTREALVDYLRAERALGRTSDPDPEAAADLLIGAVTSLALSQVLAPGEPGELDQRLERLVRLVVRGLGAPATAGSLGRPPAHPHQKETPS